MALNEGPGVGKARVIGSAARGSMEILSLLPVLPPITLLATMATIVTSSNIFVSKHIMIGTLDWFLLWRRFWVLAR